MKTGAKNGCVVRMKTLMFMSSIFPSIAGGAQNVFRDLVRSIRGRGYAVEEIYRGPSSYTRGPNGGKWEIPMATITTRNGLPTVRSLLRHLRTVVAILRILLAVRPQVVYVHFIKKEAAYFAFFKIFFRYRLVLGARGSDVLVSKGDEHDRQLTGVIRRADAVIANSEAVNKKVRSMSAPDTEVVTIYNGVDLGFWVRPFTPRASAVPIIVSVGRLEHVKGHDILIPAFRRVFDAIPSARLEIVGDGSERDSLEELARTLGVANQISFLGTLDQMSIRERLHGASLFAMPSRSEGFGIAALEALATGLPFVGSRVGGLPEIVSSDAGFLVPPGDSDALAEAILCILRSPGLFSRMSDAASARAQQFAWDKVVESYIAVFEKVLPIPLRSAH